jgi:hypothetical protein
MAHPNEELVRKGYQAFSNGDLETLGQVTAADYVHVMPGNSQVSGEFKGQDDVFAMYGKLAGLSDGSYAVAPASVTAQGDDTVVAVHRGTGTRDGKTLDLDETLTFTIEDGKIAKIVSSFSAENQAAWDAFWA